MTAPIKEFMSPAHVKVGEVTGDVVFTRHLAEHVESQVKLKVIGYLLSHACLLVGKTSLLKGPPLYV